MIPEVAHRLGYQLLPHLVVPVGVSWQDTSLGLRPQIVRKQHVARLMIDQLGQAAVLDGAIDEGTGVHGLVEVQEGCAAVASLGSEPVHAPHPIDGMAQHGDDVGHIQPPELLHRTEGGAELRHRGPLQLLPAFRPFVVRHVHAACVARPAALLQGGEGEGGGPRRRPSPLQGALEQIVDAGSARLHVVQVRQLPGSIGRRKDAVAAERTWMKPGGDLGVGEIAGGMCVGGGDRRHGGSGGIGGKRGGGGLGVHEAADQDPAVLRLPSPRRSSCAAGPGTVLVGRGGAEAFAHGTWIAGSEHLGLGSLGTGGLASRLDPEGRGGSAVAVFAPPSPDGRHALPQRRSPAGRGGGPSPGDLVRRPGPLCGLLPLLHLRGLAGEGLLLPLRVLGNGLELQLGLVLQLVLVLLPLLPVAAPRKHRPLLRRLGAPPSRFLGTGGPFLDRPVVVGISSRPA